VARIIRICSLALALTVLPATVLAAVPSPLKSYARARLADSAGANDEAVRAYEAALIGTPDDSSVALRAYREAVASGNKALAIRAAERRDAANLAPPDAVVLLYTAALSKGDWKDCASLLDRIEREGSFAFLVPTLRGWTDYAAGGKTPLAPLERRPWDTLAAGYAREHKALMLLAMGRNDEGLTAVRAELGSTGRSTVLRLSAAAQLLANKNKARALELLPEDDPALIAARKLVEAGKPLPGAINSAPKAVAALLARVAHDLMRESPSPAALTLARLASFAATPDDNVRIVLAQSLSLSGNADAALAEVSKVPASSPFASAANELRISTLQRAGRNAEALTLAEASSQSGAARDLVRLGDALSRADRPADAANAYDRAIRQLTADGLQPSWMLMLQYGSALEGAGDWARAKPALQRALALSPQQPEVLNHLGFAMLERGEDIDQATRLVSQASALRPDDAAITDSLGWAWFKRGDMARAIGFLEAAVSGDPTIAEISEHLGDAYWAAGRRIDARYSWRAALIQAEGGDVEARLKGKIADGLPRTVK
jgi:tetratricopeptide (TPR) repeat protein